MTVTVTPVDANIGRNVGPAETKENIRRVRTGFAGLPGTALIGWQEIDEADQADEHKLLHAAFTSRAYHNVGFSTAVPISVPRPWGVVESHVQTACEGLAGATPRRYVVSAVCSHPKLPDPVVFMNGHYPLARLGGAAGLRRWNDTQATWTRVAQEWHRQGFLVITTRDSNRLRNMPELHRTERQLLPNAIVRISMIPAHKESIRVHVGRRAMVNLTIDRHEAKGVELTLTPR